MLHARLVLVLLVVVALLVLMPVAVLMLLEPKRIHPNTRIVCTKIVALLLCILVCMTGVRLLLRV